ESVAVAILDRGGEGVELGRLVALKVEEDGPPPQVVGHTLQNVFPNHLKERVPRRHPFQGRVRGKERLVENDLGIFPPHVSESRLELQAKRDKAARDLADPVNMNAL